MGKLKAFFAKLGAALRDFKEHWNTPKEGDYVPNKEIMRFLVGTSGQALVEQVVVFVSFTAGCFLVGAIYRITFRDIFAISLLELIFGFLTGPLHFIVKDNLGHVPKKTLLGINAFLLPAMAIGTVMIFTFPVHWGEVFLPGLFKITGGLFVFEGLSFYIELLMFRKLAPKFGKFRTIVIVGAIPCTAIVIFLAWFPFNAIESYAIKLFALHFCFKLFLFFKPYYEQRQALNRMISPNSDERVKIQSILTFTTAPVYLIASALIPVMAVAVGGLQSINAYRYVYPAIFLLGIPFVWLMAFGVKERVLLEPNHNPDISLFGGFKDVAKNKYLWILSLSDLTGDITVGVVNIVQVMFVYQLRQAWLMGFILIIASFMQFPSLLLAPAMIRRFGKRNVFFLHQAFYLLYFLIAWFALPAGNLWLFTLGLIVSNLFMASKNIARDNMDPDVWDYQQLISGKRMEASASLLGTVLSPVKKAFAVIVPLAYLTIGFSNDWNMLYEPNALTSVFRVTILLLAGAHILGTVPFFFYDLTDKKHREIVAELKRRAEAHKEAGEVVASDIINNGGNDEKTVEA